MELNFGKHASLNSPPQFSFVRVFTLSKQMTQELSAKLLELENVLGYSKFHIGGVKLRYSSKFST